MNNIIWKPVHWENLLNWLLISILLIFLNLTGKIRYIGKGNYSLKGCVMGSCIFIVQVDLLIYSIFFNLIMMIYLGIQEREKTFSARLLFFVLASTTFISIAEVATWMCSEVGLTECIPIRYIGNVICLGLAPLPGCLGLTYLDYKIYGDEKSSKKRAIIYMIPVYFGVLSMIYNYFNAGVVFYIDELNHYHRGYLLYFSAILMQVFMFGVAIRFFLHKRLMTSRVMKATGFYF